MVARECVHVTCVIYVHACAHTYTHANIKEISCRHQKFLEKGHWVQSASHFTNVCSNTLLFCEHWFRYIAFLCPAHRRRKKPSSEVSLLRCLGGALGSVIMAFSYLVCWVAEYLVVQCTDDAQSCRLMRSSGALDAILIAMFAHEDNARVQELACTGM